MTQTEVMRIKITSIHNHGNFQKEHVILVVQEDCNTENYVLFDTTYNEEGNVSDLSRHPFLFPPVAVKKGERIALWTGRGDYQRVIEEGKSVLHRFYWGLREAVWNDEGDCALLLQISNANIKSTRRPIQK